MGSRDGMSADGAKTCYFLRLFCKMRNRSYVSEREFTRLVGRSVTPSLGRKLLFVLPLTNAQLDLTKRKMS